MSKNKFKQVKLNIYGKNRIIRRIGVHTKEYFEAWYRDYTIVVEYDSGYPCFDCWAFNDNGHAVQCAPANTLTNGIKLCLENILYKEISI